MNDLACSLAVVLLELSVVPIFVLSESECVLGSLLVRRSPSSVGLNLESVASSCGHPQGWSWLEESPSD